MFHRPPIFTPFIGTLKRGSWQESGSSRRAIVGILSLTLRRARTEPRTNRAVIVGDTLLYPFRT
jgi:hypothetical protein